jgi:YfiH family protein
VADCLPVYLGAGEWIALLHAGWKGLAAGALQAVVATLASSAGTPPSGIRVWIGPGVQSCCYPVGREVAERLPAPARREEGGVVRLDLPRAAALAAAEAGLPPDRIHVSATCTSCRGDLFFSYRRDGARSGRMAAVFWRTKR